ncbi:MAG: hypothetical protein MZV64_63250 [Ignavibacteriales bacterium]|nr:hypothetical protein [Ignavibacteriales bacterium]
MKKTLRLRPRPGPRRARPGRGRTSTGRRSGGTSPTASPGRPPRAACGPSGSIPASEAFLRAGIRKGDVLTAINKVPVRTQIDVLKSLWQAAATDQSVTYQINKEGMQIYPTFYPRKKAVNPIYCYLVVVGRHDPGPGPHRAHQLGAEESCRRSRVNLSNT